MRHSTCALLLATLLTGGVTAPAQSPNDRLFAHIYGGVAGAYIGNAMGAPVEGS